MLLNMISWPWNHSLKALWKKYVVPETSLWAQIIIQFDDLRVGISYWNELVGGTLSPFFEPFLQDGSVSLTDGLSRSGIYIVAFKRESLNAQNKSQESEILVVSTSKYFLDKLIISCGGKISLSHGLIFVLPLLLSGPPLMLIFCLH